MKKRVNLKKSNGRTKRMEVTRLDVLLKENVIHVYVQRVGTDDFAADERVVILRAQDLAELQMLDRQSQALLDKIWALSMTRYAHRIKDDEEDILEEVTDA